MIYRLIRLIRKELQAILGSKQGRMMLMVPVILQTAIFPFAATLEVKNASLAIYNQDDGVAGRELIERLSHAAAFTHIIMVHSQDELNHTIDTQSALLAVVVPMNLSRDLTTNRPAKVQMIVDGRRSNSGQIASAYALQVINDYGVEVGVKPVANIQIRNLYNPNLEYKWHVLPSLVAIITTIGCLIVTALSVAREREEGTFDQLLVSPLTPAYIMAGKAIPGVMVACVQGSFIASVAHWIYGVPFTGSLCLLLAGMVGYGLALAGVGLFISSISSTQQQAFLGVFCFMTPAVMLSGYVAPIENIPVVLQWIAHMNPLTYFILILKGVFLKGLGFAGAWAYIWPLLVIALTSLTSALYLFRRHIA
ncbi:ABC transporter permease [Undibacterium sp. SXout11W]|uniref:ABC transporter permease n=1 Tax=Undibacterium sp. SXout11W TaxID=3413050 RepID=UPI003BEFE12F